MSTESRNRAKVRATASVVGSAFVVALLVACTSSAGGGSNPGPGEAGGVAVDATKEEYIAAFEDIDPVVLQGQVNSGPGGIQSAGLEAYAEALDEWSDGKITMEIAYSNAIAPQGQQVEALNDGRLDVSLYYPSYDPARYPATAAWESANVVPVRDAVAGWFSWSLSSNSTALNTPELAEETIDQGIRTLLPMGIHDSINIGCTSPRETRDDFAGALVRTGASSQSPIVEALGGAPVSVPFNEVYEALQRGVADCIFTAMGSAYDGGFLEFADHWVMGTDQGWPQTFAPLGISEARWESMPLVAQQLIWDRLDVYVEAQFTSILGAASDAIDAALSNGGSMGSLDAGAATVVADEEEVLLDAVLQSQAVADPEDMISRIATEADRWTDLVADAGYDAVPYADFPKWYAANGESLDFGPLMELLRDEILNPNRPE